MFFIVAGVRSAAMDRLLKSGEFSVSKKKKSGIRGTVSTIYWLVAVAAFLLWTFLDKSDEPMAWVIFPVAGVLFPAILGICSLIEQKNKDE